MPVLPRPHHAVIASSPLNSFQSGMSGIPVESYTNDMEMGSLSSAISIENSANQVDGNSLSVALSKRFSAPRASDK
jgi:hypothetical protein